MQPENQASRVKKALPRGHRRSRPAAIRPLLLGVLILSVVAAILVPVYVMRASMISQLAGSPANVGTQTGSAALTPGSHARFVCRITATAANNRMSGRLLKENRDGSFSSTGSSVSIQWNPNQSLTMGTRQDVHPGAILQVSGTVDRHSVVHADQIVVLTGEVSVR